MSVKFEIFLVLLNIYFTGGTSDWTKDKSLSTKNVARQLLGTYHVEVRKRQSTRFNWLNFPSTKLDKYQQVLTKSIYTKRKITNLKGGTAKSIKTSTIKVTRTKKMTPQEDIKIFKSTNSQSTLDLDETTIDNDTTEMSTTTMPTVVSTEEEIDTSRNENTVTEKKKVTNNKTTSETKKNKKGESKITKNGKSKSTLDLDETTIDNDTNEMSTTTMPTAVSTEEEIDTSGNENTVTEKKKVTNNKTTSESMKNKKGESKITKNGKSKSTLDLDETTIDNDINEMSTTTMPTVVSTEEEIDTSRNENTVTEKKKVTFNKTTSETKKNKNGESKITKNEKSKSTLDLDETTIDNDTNEMSTTTMPTAVSTEEEIDTSRNENTVTEKKKVTNDKTTSETKKNKKGESKITKNGKSNNAQNGKHKKSTKREKDSVKKKTVLNPYDLKNDLLKVMKYFPNANATAEVIGRTVEYKDIVLLKITDANGNKKVGRADVNEVKKDRGEDIGADVETTSISKDINTTMQNENTNKGTDKEIKVKNENKSAEITTEMDAEGKKIIFIVHGLSTFELWKIPCLYETTQLKLLISFYLSHLKNFDIFLIPVSNPDGFARKDNYWNKNMSPQEGCGGVALDRNFDVAWASKSNVSSCDQFYPGPEAFSEAETEAIKDVFLRYGKRMAAYIHVHATDNNIDYRGNTVLIPKGYTDEESDEDKYLDLKGEIDEAMRKAFNTASVNLKTVYSWYGPVAGTSVDYAAVIIRVPFAMEFLMQPYQRTAKISLNQASLTHIWKRVIDTVLTFIHKINNSDESD